MDISTKLMSEHQLILQYIDVIKSLVRLEDSEKKEKIISAHGRDIIDFIQNYADRYHHAKEEEILFRHLEMPGVLTHCNPLPQMLNEHTQGREYTRGMIESLDNENYVLFCENASAFGILLSEHIYKEDQVLYPMAEEGIDDAGKKLIIEEYQDAENKFNQKVNLDSHYKQKLNDIKNKLEI